MSGFDFSHSEVTFVNRCFVMGCSNVVWLGDFNYRISLPGEDVRHMCEDDDYEGMLAYDQVS
jgi:hypothetical protein